MEFQLQEETLENTPLFWLLSFVSFTLSSHISLVRKPSRTLWGSWAWKPFYVPCFLFVGNRLHSASMTFPEFQRADSNSCYSGKGGDAETREEQSRKNSAALGQGPGSASRDTQNSIFELFCRTGTPNKWKMLTS